MTGKEKPLYTLTPLDEFKAVIGADDREDKLAGFCLVISTHTTEQLYKRRLLRKRHFEQIDFTSDLTLPLREYPVANVLAVYSISHITGKDGEHLELSMLRSLRLSFFA